MKNGERGFPCIRRRQAKEKVEQRIGSERAAWPQTSF
jgi:hypothetical protein